MKTAILAGGFGMRLGADSLTTPKPLVDVAGKPLLRHVMDIYSRQGFRDFVIALGYRGLDIKRHFVESMWLDGDIKLDTKHKTVSSNNSHCDDWLVDLVDTGQGTATGGRVRRLKRYVGDDTFMLTWCDGVADINLEELLAFHRSHGRVATLTAVNRRARFGYLKLDGDTVVQFDEKPLREDEWINGAFFVLEKNIFDYIDSDECDWETNVMQRLVADDQLMAYRFHGFWQAVDTPADRNALELAINSGRMTGARLGENL